MAETLLTVKHLVKQYGDHIVLNDISLDIKKGEVIVVVASPTARAASGPSARRTS